MTLSIFARIGDIKGESHDSRHPDEIEVLSWSWGLSQAPTASRAGGAGAGRAGKPTVRDLTFTHHIDRSSPVLMTACATGEHLRDATITGRKAGSGHHDYLVITLRDVLVTSVSSSASAETGTTVEVVELSFARVDLEYRPQKADGSLDVGVQFSYDRKTQH
jgi:type VI secretion system secreted protein Hcp